MGDQCVNQRIQFNLSIACVDGDSIFGMISRDRAAGRQFLAKYDHEGSSVSMVVLHYLPDGNHTYTDVDNPEEVYKILGELEH